MELNINRDIIKWNKLWAKDNQYTSICCLQAQKKLIWIDNVPNLSFPSSATTMMMMLTFVSLFKKFESVPELLWLVSSAVCRGSVLNVSSFVPGEPQGSQGPSGNWGSQAWDPRVTGGGTQQQATEKIYFAKQIQSLGGKNSICLRTGLCSVDFLR